MRCIEFIPISVNMNVYGQAKIHSEPCPDCHYEAFVIGGKFTCCGREVGATKPGRWKVHVNIHKRKLLPRYLRDAILEEQKNRCLYCQTEFGIFVGRGERVVFLKVCWDHMCPFSMSADNGYPNIAAACQICNGIKSNKVFADLREARTFIQRRRKELGYEN